MHLKVYTAYSPIKNISGPETVYKQQKKYYNDKEENNKDPIEAMREDLVKTLKQAIDEGDHVVLMIDANECVITGKYAAALREIGMHEFLTRRHGTDGPPTSPGTQAIDGAWSTLAIQEDARGGYLSKEETPSDTHCGLWMDLYVNRCFGNKLSPAPHRVRALQPKDPRVRDKYNQVYKAYLVEHDVLQRAKRLRQVATEGTATDEDCWEWEWIDYIKVKAAHHAAKKCRKKKMGAIPFSAVSGRAHKKVRAIDLVIKKTVHKRKINGRYIRNKIVQAGLSLKILKKDKKAIQVAYDKAIKDWRTYKGTKGELARL